MTIEEILQLEEGQTFDRKSINIDPTDLASTICAFANADGGDIAVGITNRKRLIEGVDFEMNKLNDILRAPLDYCSPTVEIETEYVPCVDLNGQKNHVLVMHIPASPEVHANNADEVRLRVGDKSKKLSFEDRTQLMYDKGMRYFEDSPVADAEIEDIDLEFVEEYLRKINYGKSAMEYLTQNKGFIKDKKGEMKISAAAILLFGKNPQLYFPRARVRFIRYEGTEEKFGAEMNVVKDVIFEGNILNMIEKSIAYLDTQIKEKTYLGSDGRFVTEEEYPKFVRQEIIVNAVTHRDYNIRGTDIQIKMFDDRIVVESPGRLPGLVKPTNIRTTHFSRNPKIAEFCKAYKYVKEFGEGVDRIYRELEKEGLPVPEFWQQDFMFYTIVKNKGVVSSKKESFDDEKGLFDTKKGLFDAKKGLFDKMNNSLERGDITLIMYNHIVKVLEEIEVNQILGRLEIKNIIGCEDNHAGKIIKIMKELKIIVPVEGKGKGKYVLNVQSL
ncbi:MAG: putative DNA binding domain-containing protein [Eubacterium sp.]|nr:putative DNA binding domain-containing protein [Eubacterium sp.]